MIKFDSRLLKRLGYASLTNSQATILLKEAYETMEVLVGYRIAQQLTDNDLSVFENLIDADDQDKAFAWLQATVPSYKQEVDEVFSVLCDELKLVAQKVQGDEGGD